MKSDYSSMPHTPMTLTYSFINLFKMSFFCLPAGHRFETKVHTEALLSDTIVTGAPYINIYLISLSVFRKMASHFNWLYYHNYLTGTFSSWWMTLLIHRRNCHNPWKWSSSSDSLTLSALLHFMLYSCYKLKPDLQIFNIHSWHMDWESVGIVACLGIF